MGGIKLKTINSITKGVLSNKKRYITYGISIIIFQIIVGYYCNTQYNKYINYANKALESEKFDEAVNYYKLADKFNLFYGAYSDIKKANDIKTSKSNYNKAIELINQKKYEDAIKFLKAVIPLDKIRYSDSQKKLEMCINETVNKYIDKARLYLKEKNYAEAIKCLGEVFNIQPNNEEYKKLYAEAFKIKKAVEDEKIAKAMAAQKEKEEQERKEKEAEIKAEAEKYAPKKIVDKNGKQIWKIYIDRGVIHFQAKYYGEGNFIVKLLDYNQDLISLIANEIGDYVVDKTVEVSYQGWYYLEIYGSDGSWSYSWN